MNDIVGQSRVQVPDVLIWRAELSLVFSPLLGKLIEQLGRHRPDGRVYFLSV